MAPARTRSGLGQADPTSANPVKGTGRKKRESRRTGHRIDPSFVKGGDEYSAWITTAELFFPPSQVPKGFPRSGTTAAGCQGDTELSKHDITSWKWHEETIVAILQLSVE